MKRIVSLLLIFAMLLTVAFALNACVTEKIIYVTESKGSDEHDKETESKEDEDDTKNEFVESEVADVSNTPSHPSEDEHLTAITAEEFVKYFEEKGFSTYWKNDQKTRAQAKKDPSVEIDFDVYENEDEARYEFWDTMGELFNSYDNPNEHGELYKLTPNIVILSRWEGDGPKMYCACVWIGETVLTYLGDETSYTEMIENLTALGYYG